MTRIIYLLGIATMIFGITNHPHSLVVENIEARDFGRPFTFAVFGDPYYVNDNLRTTVDCMNYMQDSIAFAVMVGDYAAQGARERYDQYTTVIDSMEIPLISIVGNHEMNIPEGIVNYNDIFGPTDGWFDFGDSRFIWLMNTHPSDRIDFFDEYIEYMVTDEQLIWLEDALSTAPETKFTFVHCPPAVQGRITTGGCMGGFGYNPSYPESNNAEYNALLRDYGVLANFSGHMHNFDRYRPMNERYGNVIYFITGGLENTPSYWPFDPPEGAQINHFLTITVNEDGSIDGRVYMVEYPPRFDPYYSFHYGPDDIKEQVGINGAESTLRMRRLGDIWQIDGEDRIEIFDISGRLQSSGFGSISFHPQGNGIYIVKAGENGHGKIIHVD